MYEKNNVLLFKWKDHGVPEDNLMRQALTDGLVGKPVVIYVGGLRQVIGVVRLTRLGRDGIFGDLVLETEETVKSLVDEVGKVYGFKEVNVTYPSPKATEKQEDTEPEEPVSQENADEETEPEKTEVITIIDEAANIEEEVLETDDPDAEIKTIPGAEIEITPDSLETPALISNIEGIGPKYQELLEAADIFTTKDLLAINPSLKASETPNYLHEKLLKINEEKEITKRPPTLDEVVEWIEKAKSI